MRYEGRGLQVDASGALNSQKLKKSASLSCSTNIKPYPT